MFLIACMCNQSGAAMDDEVAVAVDCASIEATECKHNSSKDPSKCKQLPKPSDCWAAALLHGLATAPHSSVTWRRRCSAATGRHCSMACDGLLRRPGRVRAGRRPIQRHGRRARPLRHRRCMRCWRSYEAGGGAFCTRWAESPVETKRRDGTTRSRVRRRWRGRIAKHAGNGGEMWA